MNKLKTSSLFTILFLPMVAACQAPKTQKIMITHYNITFAPDLSNRVNPDLYKRPLNDVDLLKIVTANLYPSILRFKRSENQKDKLLVDFINKRLISQYAVQTDKLLIDFGRFGRQDDRINYILERSQVRETLKKDIYSMVSEFSRVYGAAARQNFGADIWTYFNQGIDQKNVLPAEKGFEIESNTYVNTYRNILILPTDGYIEAGIFGKGFDLSKKRINSFRAAFVASGQRDVQDFFKKNAQFRINSVHNDNLRNLEVLVMELYDRSTSVGGAATEHPTDMEIMKLFWTDWLQQCGVKRFELHPYANSKSEAEKIILDFLGIRKML